MRYRTTFVCLAFSAIAPLAAASGNVAIAVSGANGSGTSPACELSFTAQNGMDRKISALMVDYTAVHQGSGKALQGSTGSATIGGLEPGSSKTFDAGAVQGATCNQVRLKVTKISCPRRGCAPSISQKGLAGIDMP